MAFARENELPTYIDADMPNSLPAEEGAKSAERQNYRFTIAKAHFNFAMRTWPYCG
jgi:hypothetical protein